MLKCQIIINNNDTVNAVKGSMPQYVLIEKFVSCTQASKKMLTFAQALSMNILLHVTHKKTRLPCPLLLWSLSIVNIRTNTDRHLHMILV